MQHDFDYIVIGAGSGGVASARRAASHGARVAIVESRRVGGTCVLRGCVPKKLLMYAAQFADLLHDAVPYGWDLGEPSFDMTRWADAKAAETNRLEGVYRGLLEQTGVRLFEGHARFDGPGRVMVGDTLLRAPQVTIATGAAPVRDSIEGIGACATSDELLDLRHIPRHVSVLGGGYIAVEFASMLARLGAEVHLHFRDRLPLRGFDEDLRTRLAKSLAEAGVQVHAGLVPARIESTGDGFTLHMRDGASLRTDWVLNATGRRPNTATLGLERIGVATDAQGAIPIDAHLRTSCPGVHAIGDVTNRRNLTPVAIAEGRALADALFGGSTRLLELSLVPTAVFSIPPIGTVGLTEAESTGVAMRVNVYEADFRPMKTAFIGSQERVYMKLLANADDGRVLGLHMIGPDAPEIIQSLSVALTCGATKEQFDRTLAVHPTAAEEFVLMRSVARTIDTA